MIKQILDNTMVVSVLDKPNKDGKVYPKLVVCDDYGKSHRIGIKSDQISKYKALRGQTVSLVVTVWDKTGPNGNFQTMDLESCEPVKVARAA